ncbi:cytosolic phospholipase A2 zeta-like [Centroberyx affinis]|uniref:cytosolic phospholipase A2 zeta-like n=1 Tax=Centroberyx affinis TaxID=166261 RepID=UPI003A5C03AA
MTTKEDVSYWTLSVTILRAQNNHSQDYWSESDCYVTLRLPTASARTYQTKIVPNSQSPEWNETFNFRVHSHVKNILEVKLYDDDLVSDDLISTLLFDISNLTPGKKETKVFTTHPQTKDELLVEFELLESEEPSHEYLTNGILVAAPFSALDISIDKLLSNEKIKDMVLKLRGAYQEDIKIPNTQKARNLRFYINRDLETELGVAPPDNDNEANDVTASAVPLLSAVPLQPLRAGHEGKVTLPIGQDTVDLELQTHDCMEEGLEVRLDFDIPPQEKEYLEKRKVVVGQALQKLLGLSSPPGPKKVPVIALVGSGGGTRAMTGLFGSLKGLQQIGVLDAATYITGVSGSTWTMTSLYQQANWSQQDLNSAISAMEGEMTKRFLSSFSIDKLQYYKDEMDKKRKEGHIVSLVDMWGLVLEHMIFGKKTTSTLSDQQRAVTEGQNPFPIYTAVNMKDGITGCEAEAEWCEFTPYEVGIPKYGAFVRAEEFGNQFFLGHRIKKLPEIRIPYLMGIWSSFFSVSMTQLWQRATGAQPSWTPWLGPDVSNIEVDSEPSTLDTYLLNPVTGVAKMVTDFFKNRPVIAHMYNFMCGLFLHWNYNKHSNFNAWKDTHPDAFPNRLTPADPTLRLVDAGHAINIGCVPVLRPERDVDLIISLSYSWDPDNIFKVLKRTATYCKDHEIPFPSIDFVRLDNEPQQELYVFEDKENPKAPIVLYFPLLNVTYKEFKAPGVPRVGEAEIKAGEVDVRTSNSPYKTNNMTYSKEDYQALVELMSYNVTNNKESILEAIHRALERKESKIPQYHDA